MSEEVSGALSVPNKPSGFCGRKAVFTTSSGILHCGDLKSTFVRPRRGGRLGGGRNSILFSSMDVEGHEHERPTPKNSPCPFHRHLHPEGVKHPIAIHSPPPPLLELSVLFPRLFATPLERQQWSKMSTVDVPRRRRRISFLAEMLTGKEEGRG